MYGKGKIKKRKTVPQRLLQWRNTILLNTKTTQHTTQCVFADLRISYNSLTYVSILECVSIAR